MKKSISIFLAVLMLMSLMTVSAFAAENPENTCAYGLEYGEVPMVRKTDSAGKTIYVAGNVFNSKTFPISSAPAMNNTFTYKDIVFSNYLEHTIVESVDASNNPITICQIDIGLNGAMRSNVSNVEFMVFTSRFNYINPNCSDGMNPDSDLNCYKTNTPINLGRMENGNATYGYLDYIAIRPYTNGGRNNDGTWNKDLTWVFEKHPEGTKSNGTYSKSYNIRVDKPNETLYFQVFVIDKSGATGDIIPPTSPGVTVTPGTPGGGLPGVTPTPPAEPATPVLKSFSDVPASRWSHDAIMEMVDLGMFAGTKNPDANGVGEFNPTGTMTKIQFIVVATRYLYNDELSKLPAGVKWYSNNYDLAIKHGLITEAEFPLDTVNNPITRQEMALVAVRTAVAQGEVVPDVVDTKYIADYPIIDTYYKGYVRQAFTMGLISGYDDKGTFGPKDTLTREQGAMVAYRLVNADTRKLPEIEPPYQGPPIDGIGKNIPKTNTPETGVSWKEGEVHYTKPKEGDVIIKADGTKVVLQSTHGILGLYQGVDIYTGYTKNGATWGAGDSAAGLVDNDGSILIYNKYVGEMHTQAQWNTIKGVTHPGNDNKGTHGEIRNSYWQWSDVFGWWVFIGGSSKPIQ